MGEKRRKLCSVLSAFMLCIAVAAGIRIAMPQGAHPPRDAPLVSSPARIYLDPGHGGFDAGAGGLLANGTALAEKDLVLAVAKKCGARLTAQGVEVLYSRTGDERLTYTTAADEVRARRAAAKAAGVDLLVSVHANAYAGEGRAYGPRVYYHPDSPIGAQAASRIAVAISARTSAICGRECLLVPDGSYYMLGDPTLPAVLIELGFLSDGEECALLAEESYRQALAEAISEGIAE